MSSAQAYDLPSILRMNTETLVAGPPVILDEPARNLNHEIEANLRARRIELTLEHRDLDLSISALAEAANSDELLIARLKKRRLHLKDEIARIEGHFPAWRNGDAS